jgi:hypothetical protein
MSYALTLPQHEARLAFLAVLYHLARHAEREKVTTTGGKRS